MAHAIFKEINPNMQLEKMFNYINGNNSYLTPERMKVVGEIGVTNEKIVEAILDFLSGSSMTTNEKIEAKEYLKDIEKRVPGSTLDLGDVVKHAESERRMNVPK